MPLWACGAIGVYKSPLLGPTPLTAPDLPRVPTAGDHILKWAHPSRLLRCTAKFTLALNRSASAHAPLPPPPSGTLTTSSNVHTQVLGHPAEDINRLEASYVMAPAAGLGSHQNPASLHPVARNSEQRRS